MEINEPEKIIRAVLDSCADCDVCRFLMDSSCPLFPELYRLFDKEMEGGETITADELRDLVDLCNFCALCPCPNIRADVIRAKTQFVDRDGLKFGVRTLEDVERVGRFCGTFPKLANMLFRNRWSDSFLKKTMGIHEGRAIPQFPDQNFLSWAKGNRLKTKSAHPAKRKVAYFAGCTARYLFPDVPRAAVEVLKNSGIEIYYPEQKCCGMPTMLEGDRQLTLDFVRFNVERLIEVVQDGYDIVCSCPTCGYMLRNVLSERAYYSQEYQTSLEAGETHMVIPARSGSTNPVGQEFVRLQKSIFKNILKDDGYFSSISPLKRIRVAENTYDLGEYLLERFKSDDLQADFAPVAGRMVYYPSCHLREQNIGLPYLDLLGRIPGIELDPIDGSLYCCGMAGIMGFKREFHRSSIKMGSPLMAKIKALNPDKLVTDCLSCRLQFNQMTPYKVYHPIEILKEAYFNH